MPLSTPAVSPSDQSVHRILHEDIKTLKAAIPLVPTQPTFSTIYRWATVGYRGHKLEVYRCGSRLITSTEAVARFLAATQDPTNG